MMKYKVFKLISLGKNEYSLKDTNTFKPHDDEKNALEEIQRLKSEESQVVEKVVHGYVILPFVTK